MPPVFVKENKKMLAKTCLLRTDVAGMVWKANIAREKNDFFICEGEWLKFVEHHKLEQGNTLIFFLVEKSTFQVKVYAQKSDINLQPFEELSSGSEADETSSKKGKRKVMQVSDSEEVKSQEMKNPTPVKDLDTSTKRADASVVPSKRAKLSAKDLDTSTKREDASAVPSKRAKLSAKDPNKPKKPSNPYFIFTEEFGKKYKLEVPKHIRYGKAAGDKWRQMSNDERAPYMAEAAKRLAEYRRKMAAYNRRVTTTATDEDDH